MHNKNSAKDTGMDADVDKDQVKWTYECQFYKIAGCN